MHPSAFSFLLSERVLRIGLVVLLAILLRWLVQVAVRRLVRVATARTRAHLERMGRPGELLARATGLESERQTARAATIGSMLSSAATLVIVGVAVLMVLAEVGVNLAPVLATAGVGGVALAFGAQSLVKDVLSGIFLVVEDQYGVGDQVTIGTVTGAVEEVGLRVTTVRDGNGMLWYLRNGEITRVANISQGWSMASVELLLAPDEDAGRAIEVLQQTCTGFWAEQAFPELMEEPTVLGVDAISAQAMTIKISAKCLANQQWAVQRALLQRARRALDEAGLRGPLPVAPAPPSALVTP